MENLNTIRTQKTYSGKSAYTWLKDAFISQCNNDTVLMTSSYHILEKTTENNLLIKEFDDETDTYIDKVTLIAEKKALDLLIKLNNCVQGNNFARTGKINNRG